ncbi:MAG: HD domain-containing protein [Clostridia bacterium]|nr:HD domain-containing protein [Clostridia bacterium]
MNRNNKRAKVCFLAALGVAIMCLLVCVIRTNAYNRVVRQEVFAGDPLFAQADESQRGVSVSAVPRSNTWTKTLGQDIEGLSEYDFQAYTYDFTVSNNTNDAVSDFSFKLTFGENVFLSSAWNGALELHQDVGGNGTVATVPDLREFVPGDYDLNTVTVDGESFIFMKAGDYLVYLPSDSVNAMEVPIKPREGTTPGIIIYVPVGRGLEGSTLELNYRFNRVLTSDPLFWVAVVGLSIWLVVLITFMIISGKIRKYNERHERDNVIINESIETFTGFIDAKDPYTNGHSKRVASYTRLIASQFGYEGEALDRIYYVALLHDCGKIGVPDNILRKPGKLTDEEFEIIKSHTVRGGEILSRFKSLENAGEGALYHHERYDGKGYPEGRAGDDIPFIARMICVADSFDAMNSSRVYRKKLTSEHIKNEIETNKGKQFDPEVADVMLRLIREGQIVMEDGED